MPRIEIHYSERETMPERLAQKADELGISVEQLARRFISAGMREYRTKDSAKPGTDLDDFLVQNGVLKHK